jgi:hypothetical protein
MAQIALFMAILGTLGVRSILPQGRKYQSMRKVKATLDDALARQRFDFLSAEIQLGFTFCEVARTTGKEEVARRNITNAEKAFATAFKAIASGGMSDRDARILQRQLSQLQAKIAELDRKSLRR